LMQPESEHDGDGGPLVSYYTADQVRAAIQQERERCASLCEQLNWDHALRADLEVGGGDGTWHSGVLDCAAAIRAG
jgi:hypothetical protein